MSDIPWHGFIRISLASLTQLDAFVVGVEQEGAETVGHVVIGQELQVVLAELELHGKLQVNLSTTEGTEGGGTNTVQ